MAIYGYRLARGQIRWKFVIDLPPTADGKRRQMSRKDVAMQDAAMDAETAARAAYRRADLAVDGSLAAERAASGGQGDPRPQGACGHPHRRSGSCATTPDTG